MPDLVVGSTKRRLDLQALRALAVIAVVLNHSWPGLAPGGYLGVDIFFVVSGYLITRHLAGEYVREKRIRLGRFYLRRARRLLPAATVVLVAVSIVTLIVVPVQQWEAFFREILASTFYVQNWALVAARGRAGCRHGGSALLVAVGRGTVLSRLAALGDRRCCRGDTRGPAAAHGPRDRCRHDRGGIPRLLDCRQRV